MREEKSHVMADTSGAGEVGDRVCWDPGVLKVEGPR